MVSPASTGEEAESLGWPDDGQYEAPSGQFDHSHRETLIGTSVGIAAVCVIAFTLSAMSSSRPPADAGANGTQVVATHDSNNEQSLNGRSSSGSQESSFNPNNSNAGGPFSFQNRSARNGITVGATPSYLSRRNAFQTRLTRKVAAPQDWENETPPSDVEVITYSSGALKLKAWVHRPKSGSQDRSPALVFFHGGFAFGAGDLEACRPFIDAGFVVMAPMLRGENGGDGHFELFMGEVDDARAATRWLAGQSYVDRNHVYAFGHSVGGGISALLSLFDDVPIRHSGSSGGLYDQVVFSDWNSIIPFNPNIPEEKELRLLIGNIADMKTEHYAYLGSSDNFGSAAKDAQREADSVNQHLLRIRTMPGDHFTSFEPSLKQYLRLIQSELDKEKSSVAATSTNAKPKENQSNPQPFQVRSQSSKPNSDKQAGSEKNSQENNYDGPGAVKPTGRKITRGTLLNPNDLVLVQSDGEWYPCDVQSTFSNGRVRVKFRGRKQNAILIVPRDRIQLPPLDVVAKSQPDGPPLDPKAVALIARLKTESSVFDRHDIIEALAEYKHPKVAEALSARLTELSDKHQAGEALRKLGSIAEEAVAKQLSSTEFFTLIEAIRILEDIGTSKSLPALRRIANGRRFSLFAKRAIEKIQSRN